MIIAEDEEWIVVNKPAGLLCHPTKPNGPRTLWHELRELLAFEVVNGGKISLINRLDRETSGITLAAKTTIAACRLAKAMASRNIYKTYRAIALGWPAQNAFQVSHPILRLGEIASSSIWLKRTVHPLGASATTHFYVEERRWHPLAGKISLIRAVPLTGRTHQIRVHLAHAGYPIVGDKLYGVDETCYLKFIEEGWNSSLQSRLFLERHALHSASLEINSCDFSAQWTSDLPKDMEAFLRACPDCIPI